MWTPLFVRDPHARRAGLQIQALAHEIVFGSGIGRYLRSAPLEAQEFCLPLGN